MDGEKQEYSKADLAAILMAGKIDMIVTKSISRFARNTLDCLKYIRQLKDLGIPVYFEKESINTMDAKGEVLLTIMASLAQQESQSLSQNVKLGCQYRYQQGKVQVNHTRFLGYTKDADGNLIIEPSEAETVKRIYREYLEGASLLDIAKSLEHDRIGNVIIKMPIEVFSVKPIKLGLYGIELEFSLKRDFEHNRYCLTVIQTHDGLIYTNDVEKDFDCQAVSVNPNQYKTTISVVDTYTQLTLYYGCFDYSVYSNYFSQITPPTIIAQIPDKRIIHIDGKEVHIELPNVKMAGSIYFFEEAEMTSNRRLALDDDWYNKQGYLKSYSCDEHDSKWIQTLP